MKNKKGFTLIELLAVIIILAIVALIAVPGVQQLIDNSRRKAFLATAHGLIKAAEQYYSEKSWEEDGFLDTSFEFPTHISGLEFNGKIPQSGEMKIDDDGNVTLAISNGMYCARKGKNDREVYLSELEEECNIYEDAILNGAVPELKIGMIPVLIADDGTVTKSNTTSKWYDYANQKWANAVTVTADTREKYQSADIGTEIKEEDILTYLVWIPRYKYKLWYTEVVDGATELDESKVHKIDIVFEDKNTVKSEGTSNGQYLTHPAFTFGEEELNGIWVGKFETGYNGATSANSAKVATGDSTKAIIKPNTYSWRGVTVSEAYKTVKHMNASKNIFGFGDDSDTHMMKNTEWGVVAYLSQSAFGKGSEVYINNNSGCLTGCGGDEASESKNSSCKNRYGSKEDGIYNQSTTGNISGIFDMSGGGMEYVMAYTTTATTKYGESGFTDATFPEDKYVSLYSTSTSLQFSNRILGDASGEMGPYSFVDNKGPKSSWYADHSRTITPDGPFLARGGYYSDTTSAGLFASIAREGKARNSYTFRVVIV